MTIPIVAFFNNKGGVGKTTLVHHLAWMYAELGIRVLAADLDPQANLTSAFLDEDFLEQLWSDNDGSCRTIYDVVKPLIKRVGDVAEVEPVYLGPDFDERQMSLFSFQSAPRPEPSASPLAVLPGDLGLSRFEDDLSEQWPKCLDEQEGAFRVTSAFWRVLQRVGGKHNSQLILIDIGPNLGAINRAALIAADFVAIPLAPDLFSLQGLRNLGPTLQQWRKGWKQRLQKKPVNLELPRGGIRPVGYIVLQHAVRFDRPVKAYERWAARIPGEYRSKVLDETAECGAAFLDDPHCLALLKHYRSLMPMAQEARKPMFRLKPADGAIGAHFDAVRKAAEDFRRLARELARRTGVDLPETT